MSEEGSKNRGWVVGPFKESPFNTDHCQWKWDRTEAGQSRSREQASANPNHWTLQVVVSGRAVTSFPGETEAEDDHRQVGPGQFCLWGPGEEHYWKIVESGLVLTLRWPHQAVPVHVDKPVCITIVGLPTSGKSTLATALHWRLRETLGLEAFQKKGFVLLDIDDGPALCAPEHPDPTISQEMYDRLRAVMRVRYATQLAAIEANLKEGFSVIAVATYSRHSNQDLLLKAVEAGGGELRVVWCQYADTDEEVKQRVWDRVSSSAVGGCRSVEHYRMDKERYEGIKLPHIVVSMQDGAAGTQEAIGKTTAYLES